MILSNTNFEYDFFCRTVNFEVVGYLYDFV